MHENKPNPAARTSRPPAEGAFCYGEKKPFHLAYHSLSFINVNTNSGDIIWQTEK
jgi:hypothetical protein